MGVRCWRPRIEFLVVTLVAPGIWNESWWRDWCSQGLMFFGYTYPQILDVTGSVCFANCIQRFSCFWPCFYFTFHFKWILMVLIHTVSFIEIASCHQLESGAPWRGNPGRKKLQNSARVGLLMVPGILQSSCNPFPMNAICFIDTLLLYWNLIQSWLGSILGDHEWSAVLCPIAVLEEGMQGLHRLV